MTGVRIVTDSSSDLTASETAALGIEVVPLTIRFGTDEFQDGTQLSVEGFYGLMAERSELPETAAPSPGLFDEAFRAHAAAGADSVICITLSSQLSATMQSAQNAARALGDEFRVTVVDSKSITGGLGTQVLQAAKAAADGMAHDDIVAMVEDLSSRTHVFGCLDTLDNLKKGGRIGGAASMLGSLLSIKPLIDISTGVVEEAGKPRTRRRGLEALRNFVFERPKVEHLSIMHGMAPDIDVMQELIEERYRPDEYRLGYIGPVIGAHGGPRVVGACWVDPA